MCETECASVVYESHKHMCILVLRERWYRIPLPQISEALCFHISTTIQQDDLGTLQVVLDIVGNFVILKSKVTGFPSLTTELQLRERSRSLKCQDR
mgnify:CR=1 FL=1